MITQKELKRHLVYDPNTGIFIRRISTSNRVKAGSVAGTKSSWGYIIISINCKLYRAHRLAWLYMTGEWPDKIDHNDRIKDNNVFSNLNNGTQAQNLKNCSIRNDNTSGVCGVCWYKSRKKWAARIGLDKKNIDLGQYVDRFEAICARKSAERKYGFHENHGTNLLKRR